MVVGSVGHLAFFMPSCSLVSSEMFQAFSVIAAYVMTVEMVVYPNIHQGEDHSEGRLDCKAAIAWLTSISFPAALAGYSVRHTIL
jgi:hypothetical protein